jgi:hypothetical protein
MKRNGWKLMPVVLVALALLLGAGCIEFDPNGEDDGEGNGEVLMPLAIGNEWVYRTQSEVGGFPVGDTFEDSLLIETTYEYAGETWYGPLAEGGEEGLYFINRSNGLFFLIVDDSTSAVAPGFPYPAEVGDSWEANIAGDYEGTLEVIDTLASASTGAGDFTGCMQYRMAADITYEGDVYQGSVDFFVKPGVGLVRQVGTTPEVENVELVRQLLSYTVN